MIQPTPWVQPEHLLGRFAQAPDGHHEQAGEHAHLDDRIDPDGLEVGHGLRD